MSKDLTVEEVAGILNVDEEDVRAYIRAGELEAWNKTRKKETPLPKYRISPAAVEKFRQSRVVVPQPKPQPRRRLSKIPDCV